MDIEGIPNWLYEFYGEMSNFEIIQLQAAQLDNTNSILTIVMSALFAYFMLSQFFATKLSKLQVIIISIIYSLFMLFEVSLMASTLVNNHSIQLYFSSLSGGELTVDPLMLFMTLPFISIIAWGISIIYMWTLSRRK
ncbi:hypothetical protein JYT97_03125 [Haliea sp. AH-315-K21]|uniref:Uncharacterized protein n=1 Tax=SAR86 cluster bacterium TaxID=2030880 RepID=A0A2A5CAE2_9GAMM|nr:hypothetical protein [Haliea sp. AH-315-K21]PCJ40336.1 MAG: hypothetical protein COA71_10775 [SAR86 cluster bacterium]